MKKIYSICYGVGGGTNKFLNDLENFSKINFIKILKYNDLKKITNDIDSIVIINNLTNTDITIFDLIEFISLITLPKYYIIIHDMYWLCFNYQEKLNNNTINFSNYNYNFTETNLIIHGAYLICDIIIHRDVIKLFESCTNIICPTNFVYKIYSQFYQRDNLIIVEHIDLLINLNTKHLIQCPIKNKTINIGCLNTNNYHKGSILIEYLKNNFSHWNDYSINWYIPGLTVQYYNENKFIDLIDKYEISCLLYLNIIGETWCYSLTKGLISGLPLFYNNIGSFKERIYKSNQFNYICYNNEEEINLDIDFTLLKERFINFIEFVISKGYYTKNSFQYIDNKIPYFYKEILSVD